MEQKNNLTNNDYFNYYTNKEKYSNISQNFKKLGIKKNNSKNNTLNPKKLDSNNLTIINENKKKQKQIKQCFADLIKTKQHKEKYIKKEEIKLVKSKEKEEEEIKGKINNINKSELKKNKFDNKTKNIKVNKIKIETINLENTINVNSITNRDFYQKSSERNNLINENPNNNTNYIDFNNQKKLNIISVKAFNKVNLDKDLLNMEFHNSEYINFINPCNKNTSLIDKSKNNRYNINSNTYSNNTTTGKSKISNNSSKILLSFKNIKTFYAHLEIFISLYLKRIFKFFIEKIKKYEKPKINKIEIITTETSKNNNYRPIVNVNNAHCSLYCSINLNQDKLFSTIFDNQNLYSIANNTFTPLTKRNEIKNIKQFAKGNSNNYNKRNRILLINPESDINLSTNKRYDKINNKSVYVPKKKISKSNMDLLKGINMKKNIANNDNIKSSPIKEMNINLKQINVCRLNDLNQLYSNQNQNLYKNNNNNYQFSEMNPLIKINNNNNMTNHVKYNSNNIFPMNNNNSNNNQSKDKNRLKKIQSAKNGIYIKPKEQATKKSIKEIKIKNKLSPLKKKIEEQQKHYRKKTDNILDTHNSFNQNKYLNENENFRVIDDNLYTINTNTEVNPIKKIYIKRGSKPKKPNNIHLKENLFDSYKQQFYSTFLSFKTNKNVNNINDEILVKQIITSDKRLYIKIKYITSMNENYIKKQKNNMLNKLKLKISKLGSISIINNKLEINKIGDILLNKCNNKSMVDVFSFDNDKKGKNTKKGISFSLREYPLSKEENTDNNFLNFINKLKNILVKIIINFYFSKLKNNANNKCLKYDKNNCGVYHKINYNDDFNLNKKLKVPAQKKENSNAHCKSKPYNLTSHNSINQMNNKNKFKDKALLKDTSPNINTKKVNKLRNKEINIFVHNNKKIPDNNNICNNICINKLKNKFFLMRIKLIKNALKMIKEAL